MNKSQGLKKEVTNLKRGYIWEGKGHTLTRPKEDGGSGGGNLIILLHKIYGLNLL